ncbi:AfsR/SARP family transcriptional regulator [Streptomyces albidoflavus]
MRISVLGPLEVSSGAGKVSLGGAVQEKVLSVLLLEPGRVVSVPRLVAAVWDEEPPATAAHQVRKAVSGLRERLPDALTIITQGSGYRIAVAEGDLDLLQFEEQVSVAERAVREGRPDEAADAFEAALGLWRGPTLAGQTGPVVEAAIASLEERRMVASEQLFALRLDRGYDPGLVPDLRAAIAAHPLRETLHAHHMLALYRTGRKAEALREYAHVRELLADQLGVDPGPFLTELHARLLRDDPHLLPRPQPEASPQERPGPPALPVSTLPPPLPDFTGRSTELSQLLTHVTEADMNDKGSTRVVAVDGMGGSGKTSLAVRAAHQLASHFPDGQFYIDLRGHTPGEQPPVSPDAALDHLLRSFGVSDDHVPSGADARARLWRATVTGRKVLLLLDNAAEADQVAPVVAASPGCLILVTSRSRLLDLDGVPWVPLGQMAPQDSAALLEATLGADRVAAEPDAARELAELCGHLPLALRIAGARLHNRSSWTLSYLAERLRDETRRLDELRSPQRSVAATLHLSYLGLDARRRAAFASLGLHPSTGMDVHSTAALLGTDLYDAEDTLETLLDTRLVQQPGVGIYTMHDLVRSFARSLTTKAPAPDGAAVVERLLSYYLGTSDAACQVLFPGREQRDTGLPPYAGELPHFADRDAAWAWFDRERRGLLAAVLLGEQHGLHRHVVCLARNLSFPLHARGHFEELWRVGNTALAAARRLDDPELLCVTLSNVGASCWQVGRFESGLQAAREAREVALALGDRRIQAHSEGTIGLFSSVLGHHEEALTLLREAIAHSAELGAGRAQAEGLSTLSTLHVSRGQYDEAADMAQRSLEISESIGYHGNLVVALTDLAHAQMGLDRWREADENLARARRLGDTGSSPGDVGVALALSAQVAHARGRTPQARDLAVRALKLADTGATPVRRVEIENLVGSLYCALGAYESARDLFREALRSASAMGYRVEEANALTGLGRALHALGHAAPARDHTDRASSLRALMGTGVASAAV